MLEKCYIIILGVLALVCCGRLETSAQSSQSVTLLTDVQPSLAMIISDRSINFGMLTAGSPQNGGHGIDVAVSTNSANGYSLAISDGVPEGQSSLLHSDGGSSVPDFSASISAPEEYRRGISTGLAFTLFAAMTSKETKWGSGTSFDDLANRYAGIGQDHNIFHQAYGFKDYVDHSYISFILDVPSNQKTGNYQGNIVLSSTCMLN